MTVHRCPRRDDAPFNPSTNKSDETPDTWRSDEICSYCGSMSQAAFFAAIENGAELGPTDKNYKVYVHSDGSEKFYFQHLDTDGRAQFIVLMNERKINIGVPGYFYMLPYFVQVHE